MIVSMKRVALIAPESQRDEFLTELRKLGVVHIKHVNLPSAGSIGSVEEQISKTNKAIVILEGCRIPRAAGKVIWEPSEMAEKAKEITAMASEREDLAKSQIYLKNRLEQFKPWGSFDPKALKAFADKDISVRLYRTTKRAFKKASKEDGVIQIINEDKQYVYIAQVCKIDDGFLPFEEVRFPDESFEELYNKHESFKKRIEEIESDLRASARAQESLKEYLKILESKKVFLNVASGMGREKGFSYLRGYCPIDRVNKIKELAVKNDLGCLVEDTSDSEEAPTLIKNPKWLDIISPVFKFMNTVPGYSEFDISLPFLIFFSLFFAMLIGDAGYGFLFLVGTYLARRKLRSAPIQPFALMYVLSAATIVWGAVSGVWFGSEEISKLPFINALIIQRVNGYVAANQDFIIYLCFIIGAIHLVIAHLIRAFRTINNLVALSEIGWALTLCGLFFTSGTLVIDRPFPEFAKY
ncbi:MAG: hypothetical protein V3S04_03465, partial [Candidatus Omnitrophota bacterium]